MQRRLLMALQFIENVDGPAVAGEIVLRKVGHFRVRNAVSLFEGWYAIFGNMLNALQLPGGTGASV